LAWHLEGTCFENCFCGMVYPCATASLTMPADYERCQVVLASHIDSEKEGTRKFEFKSGAGRPSSLPVRGTDAPGSRRQGAR
jgi:hypothetical protein